MCLFVRYIYVLLVIGLHRDNLVGFYDPMWPEFIRKELFPPNNFE